MSGVGGPSLHSGSPEVMNTILLRSSTPGTYRFAHSEPYRGTDDCHQLPTKKVDIAPQIFYNTSKLMSLCCTVLLYLEKMQSDPPEPGDRETNPPTSPRSQTIPARVTSPMLRGSNSGGSGARRSGPSELSYVTDKRQNGHGPNGLSPPQHDHEIRSDIQEGRDSDAGAPVPIRITGRVSVVVRFMSFCL